MSMNVNERLNLHLAIMGFSNTRSLVLLGSTNFRDDKLFWPIQPILFAILLQFIFIVNNR